MTSPQQLEILDLRHFGAGQLRPLLEREADVWERRLRWDYRSSTELLLQYLDSRILPGFVALHDGRICGFSFCVYEGQKAVIGDIYADPTHPEPLSVVNTLTRHLLETLNASPDVHRIEAQLLLFDSDALVSAFFKPGSRTLAVYPRLRYLRCPIFLAAARAQPAGLQSDCCSVAVLARGLRCCACDSTLHRTGMARARPGETSAR